MPQTFLGGTLNFAIDSVAFRLAGSFSENIGGIERSGKSGPDSVIGFTQKYAIPMIDCELVDDGTVSIALLKSVSNSTLTIEYDNGKTVIYTQAWQEGEVTLDGVEAKIKAKFAGRVRTEIPA